MHSKNWRDPERRDYVAFFVGMPLMFALAISLIGVRWFDDLSYILNLTYVTCHMLIIWWIMSTALWVLHRLLRALQPPIGIIYTLAFFLSLVPATFLLIELADMFGHLFPVFAEKRPSVPVLSNWTLEYMIHFFRDSIGDLLLYVAGLYGYQFAFGVRLFSFQLTLEALPNEISDRPNENGEPPLPSTTPTAALLHNTRLPPDAVLLAVKAEQHYIRVWSDKGEDFIRYRFRDVVNALEPYKGLRVHRSWWVNMDSVQSFKNGSGTLVINDDLRVPVSLSNRRTVLLRLKNMTGSGVSGPDPTR